MTTPTREQVIEWALEANFDVRVHNSIDGEEAQCDSCKVILTDQLLRLCTLAMSAGRDQGLREAATKVRAILADCEARDIDDPELEQVAQDIEQLRACGSAATPG